MVTLVLNEVATVSDYSCSNNKKDDNLLFIKKLLLNVNSAQELQWLSLSVEEKIKRFDEVLKYFIKDNYNSSFISELRWDEDKSEDINSNDSVHINDRATFKKYYKKCDLISTSLTSITDSETQYNSWNLCLLISILTDNVYLRYFIFNEKKEDFILNLHFAVSSILLLSRYNKSIYKASDAVCRDIEFDYLFDENKKDKSKEDEDKRVKWENKET